MVVVVAAAARLAAKGTMAVRPASLARGVVAAIDSAEADTAETEMVAADVEATEDDAAADIAGGRRGGCGGGGGGGDVVTRDVASRRLFGHLARTPCASAASQGAGRFVPAYRV